MKPLREQHGKVTPQTELGLSFGKLLDEPHDQEQIRAKYSYQPRIAFLFFKILKSSPHDRKRTLNTDNHTVVKWPLQVKKKKVLI